MSWRIRFLFLVSVANGSTLKRASPQKWTFDDEHLPSVDSVRQVVGKCDWGQEDLLKSPFWGFELTESDLEELDTALSHVKQSKDFELLDGWQPMGVTRENFPLPRLGKTLAAMAHELESGRGAVMIRNMPVESYSVEDVGILYAGVNSYIGQWVPQSSAGLRSKSRGYGMPLGKVFAEMKSNTPVGGKQANNHFRLHTDRCDVITLLCIRPASKGGASRVCSAVRVHNAMVRECPDVCARLYRPYHRIWEGSLGYFDLPVWSVYDGQFTTQVSPSYIENAQLLDGVPRLDAEGIEAVDLLEEYGLRDCHEFCMKPGMVYWLNNHVVWHGRDAWSFDDAQDDPAANGRLMLRMWLSPYQTRDLPPTDRYRLVWGSTNGGVPRGGLDPAIRSGITPKSRRLVDAVQSGEHTYYSLFKRKYGQDATTM